MTAAEKAPDRKGSWLSAARIAGVVAVVAAASIVPGLIYGDRHMMPAIAVNLLFLLLVVAALKGLFQAFERPSRDNTKEDPDAKRE